MLSERMVAMMNYMQTNYQTVTLEGRAQQFHLSTPYISKYIKEKSGKTFGEQVIAIRMKRAKTLLKNGNMTVENISHGQSVIRMWRISAASLKRIFR